MAMVPALFIALISLGLVGVIINIIIKKGVSGVKIMLLGISIMIFGGILAVDPDATLGGMEYLIVLIGLIISIVGFGKKE